MIKQVLLYLIACMKMKWISSSKISGTGGDDLLQPGQMDADQLGAEIIDTSRPDFVPVEGHAHDRVMLVPLASDWGVDREAAGWVAIPWIVVEQCIL